MSTHVDVTTKTRYLQDKNNDIWNTKIKFEDEGHKYWAYSKFYEEWVSSNYGGGGAPIVSTTTVLSPHFPYDSEKMAMDIWNNPKNRLRMETDPTYKYYKCTCLDDIKLIWSTGSKEGTKMHANFEDLANIVEYDKDNHTKKSSITKTVDKKESTIVEYKVVSSAKNLNIHLLENTETMLYTSHKLSDYEEKMYFFMFINQFNMDHPESDLSFFKTEMLMWHDILHISGTIDALLYNKKTDSYVIVDWKRCKNGVKTDPNPNNPRTKPVHLLSAQGRGQGLPAFEMLRNNTYNKYGCQLTLYKFIFEYMTGKKISGLYIVAIDNTKIGQTNALKIHEVPLTKFDECIRQVFENRAREMLGKYADTLDDNHLTELINFLPDDDDPGTPVSEDENINVKRKIGEVQ